jgi:hypothetical protein
MTVSKEKTSTEPHRKGQVPEPVREQLLEHLSRSPVRSLEGEFRGRFCYITHQGSPLCRLGYRGEADDWDFAIYRYTTNRYDADLFGMPDHDSVDRCLSVALHAYDLA